MTSPPERAPHKANGTAAPRTNGHAQSQSRLLDALPHIVASQPSVATAFLATSKAANLIVCAQLYRDLDVEIAVAGTMGLPTRNDPSNANLIWNSCCPGPRQVMKVWNVLSDYKYAHHVRVIRFRHPCPTHALTAPINTVTRESDRLEAWSFASSLLMHCPRAKVEEVYWETGLGINDELWTAISQLSGLKRLHLAFPPQHPAHFNEAPVYPRLTPALQQVVPKGLESAAPEDIGVRAIGREGLALGAAWEDLEVLHLEGLSLQGAWTMASHLELLTELNELHQNPKLHTLAISTHFLDLRLCKAVANFGKLGTLKHLSLSTTGTKLNAECLNTLLKSCTVLESLKLTDIEETGSHHSWVLKHLSSITEVPIAQLKRFAVRRIVPQVACLPFPPPNLIVPPQLPSHSTGPIPSELLDLVRTEGDLLEDLCLDWWQISGPALEAILMACPRLRQLQVNVKTTVFDIINMTTAFGNVPDLAELNITTDPKLATPAVIKVKASKKKPVDGLELPPFLADKVAESDPTLVEVRDLRKFARRLPEFRVLRWIGRQGKGEWRFTSSKKASLSPVQFVHSAVLTRRVWEECQLEPPSFQFEDECAGSPHQLQIPVSPERLPAAEFPPLSRTTTGGSISIAQSPTTPIAPAPMMRRSSTSTGGGGGSGSNPLGLEWDSLAPNPPVTKPASISIGASRKGMSVPPSASGRSDPQPPKANENRTRGGNRSRRDSKPRLTIAPPSPTKEPRHVPGSAPKKQQQSAPPSPSKSESGGGRERCKDKDGKRAPDDGWTTVGNERGRKK